ncbi:hypothetical protein ACFQI7_24165 [Paenibacillus allorhizosphaerae]|uniref:hypothetical protein n=1 Tax=Paenibacillus allorhizosphaerae TaxID=2849866 RepID=UPI001C40293C|nr:hypothetical protein [Paenibacillus allorhizosphaerae]
MAADGADGFTAGGEAWPPRSASPLAPPAGAVSVASGAAGSAFGGVPRPGSVVATTGNSGAGAGVGAAGRLPQPAANTSAAATINIRFTRHPSLNLSRVYYYKRWWNAIRVQAP